MKSGKGPRVFSIVGRSGSGKTTLAVKLVARYAELGISVGVIKHTGHDVLAEDAGKDSHLYRGAGASGSVVTDGKGIVFTASGDWSDPESIVRRCFEGCGLVLVEGWKESDLPKLEVVGPSSEPPLFTRGVRGIRFIVARGPVEAGLPVYGPDDIEAIARAIDELVR